MALAEPSLPYVSGVTGEWIRPEEATSPEYWARHAREPVRFAAAVKTLTAIDIADPVGGRPGQHAVDTGAATRATAPGGSCRSLPDATGQPADDQSMLDGARQAVGRRASTRLAARRRCSRARASRCRPIRSSAAAIGSTRRLASRRLQRSPTELIRGRPIA